MPNIDEKTLLKRHSNLLPSLPSFLAEFSSKLNLGDYVDLQVNNLWYLGRVVNVNERDLTLHYYNAQSLHTVD